MINGHGDDAFRFARPIVANFSSNVYGNVDLESLKAHLRAHIDAIGHYPEPEPYTLEAALAARHGIDPAAVCVTNGATEAIYLTAHAFAPGPSTILQPTFTEYADACRLYSHPLVPALHNKRSEAGGVSMDEHFFCEDNETPERSDDGFDSGVACWPGAAVTVRQGEMPRALGVLTAREKATPKSKTGGAQRTLIWLCNPNNPTGTVIPKDQLITAIEGHPETTFVIDQSYGSFTLEPLLTAAEAVSYPNVIQLHSMTKRYAMPGLRLGYITAHPKLTDRIRAVRMPWSVNALAIEAGLYLAAHPDTAPIDLSALLAETQRLRDALNALDGIAAEPTQTHFFLCHLAEGTAADLKQWLAGRHGLLIRDAANFEGLDAGHFRIATQTPAANDALVAAIRQYLENRP